MSDVALESDMQATTSPWEERRRRIRMQAIRQELEFRRITEDFLYFASHYCYVETADDAEESLTLFKAFDFQEETLDKLLNNKLLYVLKTRQLGMTTMLQLYSLWQALRRRGSYNCVTMSYKQTEANGALDKFRIAYLNLPEWLQARMGDLSSDNSEQMVWTRTDGARTSKVNIRSIVATANSGAGNTLDLLSLDEFALYPDQSSTWRAVSPATWAALKAKTNHARVVVNSTARGASNMYAQLYREIRDDRSNFEFLFHPRSTSPFLTEELYEFEKARYQALGEPWLIHSEFPETPEEAFMESGGRRFQDLPAEEDVEPWLLQGRVELSVETGEYEFIPDMAGNLYVRDPIPQDECLYIVPVDPAAGGGGDATTSQILEMDPSGNLHIWGEWHSNKVDQEQAAEEFNAISYYLNGSTTRPALINVENQGSAGALMLHVLRRVLQHPNLYSYKDPTKKRGRRDNKVGMPMTPPVKRLVLDTLGAHLNEITGFHPDLMAELRTFVQRPNGKCEADYGAHDDRVMCLAIGVYTAYDGSVSAPSSPVQETEETEDGKIRMYVGDLVAEAAAAEKVALASELKDRQRREHRQQRKAARRRRQGKVHNGR